MAMCSPLTALLLSAICITGSHGHGYSDSKFNLYGGLGYTGRNLDVYREKFGYPGFFGMYNDIYRDVGYDNLYRGYAPYFGMGHGYPYYYSQFNVPYNWMYNGFSDYFGNAPYSDMYNHFGGIARYGLGRHNAYLGGKKFVKGQYKKY